MDVQVAYALLQTDPAHAADLLSGELDASQLEPQSLWDLAEGVRDPTSRIPQSCVSHPPSRWRVVLAGALVLPLDVM